MPRTGSSDQPRVMVGLSGWSAFNGVHSFLSMNRMIQSVNTYIYIYIYTHTCAYT